MGCGPLSPQGSYAMEVEGEQVHQVRAAGRMHHGTRAQDRSRAQDQ